MFNDFENLSKKWPSSIVARSEVRTFSGGILSGKTLANLASKGLPVPRAIRVGRKVAYSAEELAQWLGERSKRGIENG